jgi:hypothetical protein
MTTTPVTDELSNHKLAATFGSDQSARQAQRELVGQFGLEDAQVLLITPGEPFPGRRLEPESRGIARTLVVSHVRLGLLGGIAGLLAFAVLYAIGVPFIVQSPLASVLVLLGFGLVAGMMMGGLVSLRPDHDRYINAARDAMQEGRASVVVHAFSREQQEQAAEWLRARGADVTSTL